MDLPASMADMLGYKVLRMGTSHDRERFFFDIPAARENNRRIRYGYELPEGRILRSHNIKNLLGQEVLAIYDGGTEGTDEQKLVFETNPTETKIERIVFYLQITEPTSSGYWLLESDPEEELELEEGDGFWELEESGGPEFMSIQDEVIPKNIYPNRNSDDNFYTIQFDDFEEPDNE
jgi:hypothetical protein